MNKKGSGGTGGFKGGYYVFALFLITIGSFLIIPQIKSLHIDKIYFDADKSLILNRAIQCLSTEDLGVIDKSKFNDLDTCFKGYNQLYITIHLSIEEYESSKYNIVLKKTIGKEHPTVLSSQTYILITDGKEINKGRLTIEYLK
ncbi:hypothetical protein J4403_00395 [Candidatus Woesearchaeota archaeon]|nr:hypothetical protein [Candidatus Woesearchaeota archaeon]